MLNKRSMSKRLATVLGNQTQYYQKIKRLGPIAYWPLWESVGASVTEDVVGGFNGVPTGANLTLGTTGIGDSKTAYQFGGLENFVNPFSAGLASAWNGNEYTISTWVQIDSSAWTDGALRRVLYIGGSGTYISLSKPNSANNQLDFLSSSGTLKTASLYGMSGTNFFHIGMTGSQTGNLITFYWNGLPFATSTFNAAFTPTSFRIGTQAITPSYSSHLGKIQHLFVASRAFTAAEMRSVATLSGSPFICFSYLGDSVTSAAGSYKGAVTDGYTKRSGFILHAVPGENIAANMSSQVTAAANDNANIIIIALGTNDDNAGNMTTLQATYETQVAALKASNPNATIYAMNVLPRWTDNTGTTPVDKSNIRTAIAAACTAQSITCWDTFTTPWIDAADTSDGLHPIAAGHAKIAAEVLSRL